MWADACVLSVLNCASANYILPVRVYLCENVQFSDEIVVDEVLARCEKVLECPPVICTSV